ncbi:MAG: hypothetical protein ACI4OY_03540 [Aristaeellaceae bacterium]
MIRVTRYPGMLYERLLRKPQGTLCIRREEHRVVVTCGEEYRMECLEDHTWRLTIDSLDGAYRAELTHRPQGYPLWYGREKPSCLTQHSVTYGYNWAGDVEVVITLEGRAVRVRGRGIRERYVAVDSSAAELGGWEDWGWVAFDQIHTSFYDMRLGMKDFSLYDLETGAHDPEGTLTIQHEDWAFMRELDGFIPTTYRIRMAVEGGVLDVKARVGNATTWGVTYRVPDYPVATLTFRAVEGTFTNKDGIVRPLSGGRGALSVRQ